MSIIYPENEKTVTSDLDPACKIDIHDLKQRIAKHGPLRVRLRSCGSRVIIDVHPCPCGEQDCTEDVITVKHDWGELPIATTVNVEDLCASDSLNAFCASIVDEPLLHFSSCHERQQIEAHLADLMQAEQFDIYSDDRGPDEVHFRLSEVLGEAEDTPKVLALLNLAGLLRRHSELAKQTHEVASHLLSDDVDGSDQELLYLVQYAYDLGFLTGRLKDNYFAECEIVPWAEKGFMAQKAQEKRAKSGAEATAAKAALQRASLVSLIEEVLRTEPWEFIMQPVENRARLLREAAQATRQGEFCFRKAEVLSLKWFVGRLEDLEADGTLKRMFEQAAKKA